jgi:crotonobetainyl-CoA:carnitine CoA-transferase CaiB-like acyl-CoA transferase
MPPLSGLNVLDLSRVLAGPYCTQLLADLGATVWKVESPRGDESRAWGPPFVDGESAYYLSTNRNKLGLTIDLKDPRGQRVVRDLAARADVLVENFKTGDLERYGLDDASLRTLNPRLVYVSITGFGHDGPRAHEPGYDLVLQALSGIMHVTGESEGAPAKIGVAWVDVLTGVHAAVAALSALLERDRSGLGQAVDVAMFDVALACLVNQAQAHLLTGSEPQRMGSRHPQLVPYEAFRADDGWFVVAVGNDRQFGRLCDALGTPEWAEDARFATNSARVANRDTLVPRLRRRFATARRAQWLRLLGEANVPVAEVQSVGEALRDPQALARGMRTRVSHPAMAELPMVASALRRFSRSDPSEPTAPPRHGEHSTRVLRDVLGLPADEVRSLEAAGVVRSTPPSNVTGDDG